MTQKDEYNSHEEALDRILELLHHRLDCMKYKKRTEIFLDIVQKIESENQFPKANYAFDSGVMSLGLTKYIEESDKEWVTEVEKNRHIMWDGKYQRVDVVAERLRKEHPESFRFCRVKQRNNEIKEYWVFSKTVRVKKYGRKRLVIAYEKSDLSDEPHFYLSSATHWESVKILKTWSYRWSIEVFHELGKQNTGLESAQIRKEEGVHRHLRLSCISQSLVQRVDCLPSKSEKYSFADGKLTFGQRCRSITRETYASLLSLAEHYFKLGMTSDKILEVIMPV